MPLIGWGPESSHSAHFVRLWRSSKIVGHAISPSIIMTNNIYRWLIICVTLAAVLSTGEGSTNSSCYCGYRKSGLLVTLRCASDASELPQPVFRPVLCERMGGIVRIGDSNSVTAIREETGVLGMGIDPYGLSQLQFGGKVTKLQLNIPLQAKLLDALAFAGLPSLQTLHAWRAPIALDGCSLTGLSRLEDLVISCGSTFDRFITFGPAFKSIRLIGCLGRPLQFICTQCTQRPNISVLRVLPGPPSPGGIVSFESWWNSSSPTSQPTNSVDLGKCRPGVCSDDHMCRNNHALKVARSFVPRRPWSMTTPALLTTEMATPSPPFISIFLPVVGCVLVLSFGICLFMSLRISGKLRSKRKLVHLVSHSGVAGGAGVEDGLGGIHQGFPEPTAPPDAMLQPGVPLTRNTSIKK